MCCGYLSLREPLVVRGSLLAKWGPHSFLVVVVSVVGGGGGGGKGRYL